MPKPSILFINRVYAPDVGATGRLLRDLAQGFAADGWDVKVITTGKMAGEFLDKSVEVIKVHASSNQSILNYLYIFLKLLWAARHQPVADVVITMTDPPMMVFAGYLLTRRRQSIHIHWSQDVYPDLLPLLGIKLPNFIFSFLKRLTNISLQHCIRVIAIGDCMGRKLLTCGIDPRRLIVIPNWPDKEFFPSEKNSYHKKPVNFAPPVTEKPLHTNNERKFRVLYAGNIGRAHDLSTILDAAAILQLSNPEIEFLFVGQGQGHERVARERARRQLDNIKMLPPQPLFQLREMMQSGDLHLVSMKMAAAGLIVPSKTYAALAAERPCVFIGPQKSEAAEILLKYEAGTIVQQGDARKLAAAIVRYRMDGDLWFSAHQGAVRAKEEIAGVKAIQSWIACVRSVIHYPAS